MDSRSLSDRLRAGFLSVVRPEVIAALDPADAVIDGVAVPDLPAAVRKGTPHELRERLWRGALVRYRTRSRSFWGPVVLEMLAPGLIQELGRIHAVPPVIEAEDLEQLMITAALEAALVIPLRGRRRYAEARVIRRAATVVKRALARELRRQAEGAPLEELDGQPRVDVPVDVKRAARPYPPSREREKANSATAPRWQGRGERG